MLLRTLVGVALAGVVATAIGHIGDEADRRQLGSVMGLYIGGTCLGGVLGRILPGVVADHTSWRVATLAVGLLATIAVTVFTIMVPVAQQPATSTPWSTGRPRHDLAATGGLLADRVVCRLCLIGFCLMGGYVACMNYVAYRLTSPPFILPVGAASLTFLLAASGILSSPLAGRLADRFNPRGVTCSSIAVMIAGLALTLTHALALFAIGLALFTAAFFAAHAVVNSWLAHRACHHRSAAAGLYLTSYYIGSSAAGSLIGIAYRTAGWTGTISAITALCIAALLITATTRPSPRGSPQLASVRPPGASAIDP